MASQEYIGYLYEAQAELVLQRNNLMEITVCKAWDLFPNVVADIKAKATIIENMLNHYEPPNNCQMKRLQKLQPDSRWQRLTKLESADMINGVEDLINIAVTAVVTLMNEVESMIDRHVPSTSHFMKKERCTSRQFLAVHWGPSQSLLFNHLHAPASLTQKEWSKYRETEVFQFPSQSFITTPLLPNPLRLC